MLPVRWSMGVILSSALVLGILAGGCSPVNMKGVEKVYAPQAFTAQELREGGVAVGGLILARGIELYPTDDLPDMGPDFDHHAQSYLWSLLVDGVWSVKHPQVPLMPFTLFEGKVSGPDLNRLLDQVAELRSPEPELLRTLAAAQPEVRYLLLARIDGDQLEYDSTAITPLNPPEGGLGRISDVGREGEQPSRPLNPEVRRIVTVTLEVVDLKAARSVWEGRVQREERKRVQPNNPSEGATFKVEKVDQDQVAFRRDETLPDSPAFASVLEKCLSALVDQLVRDGVKVDNESIY